MAADCMLGLLDEADTEPAYVRRMAAAVLLAEWREHMIAMRLELRSFIRAMAKAR